MSLFKARQWWSTTVGEDETFDLGCLCVANIDNNNNGLDKIILGSYNGFLRIFNPRPVKTENGWSGFKAQDVVCEMQLPQPILQIEAGKFVSGSDSLHLAILHPRKLSVYSLAATAGAVEHGVSYTLKLAYEHNLQRTSFNFCYGSFGGVKNRDFICVQSMDCTLSVFEQESFAFCRFLPGSLLPGPLVYNARTDSFLTISSSRQVESYKYQVLAVASDAKTKEESANIKSGKRVAFDWTLNVGEQAFDMKIVPCVNNPPSIYVLGERNLFVLTEGGKLKLTKKLEYNPSCFVPYQSATENNINCIVASHTKTLMVYENTTLRWAAQLEHVPVQIRLATLSDLQGVLVTVDEGGHLECSYLGTDPAMLAPPSAEVRELDYAEMDQEMKQLQKVIKEQQSKSFAPMPNAKAEEDLQIQIHVPPSLDEPSLAQEVNFEDEDQVPSITVKVSLRAKSHVNDIKMCVHVKAPIASNENVITISSIEPAHPYESQVTFYMKTNILPSDLKAEITATYLSAQGSPRVIHAPVRLPMKLVIKPCLPVKSATYKITIDTNKAPANLNDLFPDLLGENAGGPGNALGFKCYGMEPTITLLASKTSQRYRLQSDDFSHIWLLLSELVSRLSSHFRMGRGSDFKISYDGALPLTEYFEILDAHFESRANEEKIHKMMDDRAAQFRAIQRRLLMRFKDKTPSPLANLDTLLEGTYRQLLALADAMEENKMSQLRTAAALSCSTRTLNMLVKLWQDMTPEEFAILEAAISPNVMINGSQGWEEMVDVAVTHLLRTCLAKSSKDMTVNPTPLGMLKETTKLKKHIALVCDRLGKGSKLMVEGQIPVTNTGSSQSSSCSTNSRKPSTSHESSSKNHKPHNLRTTLDDSQPAPPRGELGDVDTPEGSKYGEKTKKSPRAKKHTTLPQGPERADSMADFGGSLPPLGGATRGDQINTDVLPPLTSEGSKFLKKKVPSASDDVPDLDDLGSPADDDSVLMNGGNEMVYGL